MSVVQGVAPAILHLQSGCLRTATLQGPSLASLLQPIIESGILPAGEMHNMAFLQVLQAIR
jgi:hypothetical protein